MITGLLFTLAQKPVQPANDDRIEGHHFPPSTKPKARQKLVTLARAASLVLAIVGGALMLAAFSNWSFDPEQGLRVQAAGLKFIFQVGVSS